MDGRSSGLLPGLFPVSCFLLYVCAARAECRPSAVAGRTSRVTSARGCLHPSFVRILRLQKAEEPQKEDDRRRLVQGRRHMQRAAPAVGALRLGSALGDVSGFLLRTNAVI